MPLHTDYRPIKLDDVVGNQSVVQALKTHLAKSSPNRSILFTGGSGMGKTTLATCLANELGAMDSWNFKMLNASDFRGIDTVREVREAANRTPLGSGRARVWLWDECHKISPDGQEAMLKLLEHPPKDCWFLLATTNAEKLKVTLKRRCTEYQVEPLSSREMLSLLLKVAKAESRVVSKSVLEQIVQDSLGSAGVALNILDKIIDLPAEQMAKEATRLAEKASSVIELCRLLLKEHRARNGQQAWKRCCDLVQALEQEDAETVRRQVLEYLRKVLLGGEQSVYGLMICFSTPYYDTGKAGLAMSIYEAFCRE